MKVKVTDGNCMRLNEFLFDTESEVTTNNKEKGNCVFSTSFCDSISRCSRGSACNEITECQAGVSKLISISFPDYILLKGLNWYLLQLNC